MVVEFGNICQGEKGVEKHINHIGFNIVDYYNTFKFGKRNIKIGTDTRTRKRKNKNRNQNEYDFDIKQRVQITAILQEIAVL